MKVLVTGHQGYIGRVLAPMVQERGHQVKGLDTGLFGVCDFGTEPPEVQTLDRDLRDVNPADLEGLDAIIHLAGICNDPLGNLNPLLTHEVNYVAALRFAKLAKAAGVSRFICSSSCSIYGKAGEEMVTEESELNPVTIYGETKKEFDVALVQMADKDFCPVFLRNATAYGASPRLRLDLVLNEMVADAVTTGRILIRSDGTPWRPLVHIEDISRAFIAVLEARRTAVFNEAFNVGQNEENYQISELATTVGEVVPGARIEYAANGGPDKRCYRVDCSKIRRHLPAFQPQWNARLGACQMRDSFIKHRLTARDVAGSLYRRVNTIQEMIASGTINESLRFVNQAVVQSA